MREVTAKISGGRAAEPVSHRRVHGRDRDTPRVGEVGRCYVQVRLDRLCARIQFGSAEIVGANMAVCVVADGAQT